MRYELFKTLPLFHSNRGFTDVFQTVDYSLHVLYQNVVSCDHNLLTVWDRLICQVFLVVVWSWISVKTCILGQKSLF